MPLPDIFRDRDFLLGGAEGLQYASLRGENPILAFLSYGRHARDAATEKRKLEEERKERERLAKEEREFLRRLQLAQVSGKKSDIYRAFGESGLADQASKVASIERHKKSREEAQMRKILEAMGSGGQLPDLGDSVSLDILGELTGEQIRRRSADESAAAKRADEQRRLKKQLASEARQLQTTLGSEERSSVRRIESRIEDAALEASIDATKKNSPAETLLEYHLEGGEGKPGDLGLFDADKYKRIAEIPTSIQDLVDAMKQRGADNQLIYEALEAIERDMPIEKIWAQFIGALSNAT